MKENLNDYRASIDKIDEEIQELFVKRMEIASKIAEYKHTNNISITNSNREEEIFNKISNNKNKIISNYYLDVQKCIIKKSKEYQKALIDTLKK